MCKFRDLKADEIEVRVQSAKENGVILLLYKDARVDMNILDETVGAENWQNKFYEHKGILFCSLGINTAKEGEQDRWIWKDDAGVESNTEAEKGNASDARKRAGFAWGIGRELYTSPFIWVGADKCDIKQSGKGYQCFDKFAVSKIEIENKVITALEIFNDKKQCVAYSLGYGRQAAPPKAEPIKCADCGKPTSPEMAARTHKAFGVPLCKECGLKRSK